MVRIDEQGCVSVEPYNPAFEKWNAVAQCDVPLETIRSMFVFQTDHFDVNDVCEDDIRFYIDKGITYSAMALYVNERSATFSNEQFSSKYISVKFFVKNSYKFTKK